MIFDTHAHYDDEVFNEDREELFSSFEQEGVGFVTNVSANLKGIEDTLKLIEKYDFIYGAAGVHPSDTGELNDSNFEIIREALKHKKMVAVGEIGLDYYWKEPEKDVQVKWFERQLNLAHEVKKPLIIHSRDASNDTMEIMKSNNARDLGGVIHCYSYSVETAKQYLDMGFYLGIGGVLTFNNAKKLRDVVEYMPLDRILTETDAPYLTPVPFRGKRNNSTYIKYVIAEIAKIKKVTIDEVTEVTFENAFEAYKIKKV